MQATNNDRRGWPTAAGWRAATALCAIVAGTPPALAHVGTPVLLQEAEAAVAQRPNDPEARFHLGKSYQVAGRWDEALVAFDEARERGADRDACDTARATVLLAAGFPRAAKRELDHVLARRPDVPGVLLERARAWTVLGEHQRAADDYAQAVTRLPQLQPEHVMAWRDALVAAGRPLDAVKALDDGMARLGPLASLQLAALDLEVAQQRWAAAVTRLDQLLKQTPHNEAWIARRGDLLQKLGRRDEARAEWERALRLLRDRPARRRAKAHVDLAQHLEAALAATGAPSPAPPRSAR